MANSRHDPEQDLQGTFPRGGEVPPRKPHRPATGRFALEQAMQREQAEKDDSILPTPASLKDTSREQLDHNVDMIRRIRAGEIIGEVSTEQVADNPMQPELPLETAPLTEEQRRAKFASDVARFSQGQMRGH